MFYQDFKDTFVCNTQLSSLLSYSWLCCFIRISKILLYAIHNTKARVPVRAPVVLSGFQRYFCMQYTTWWVRAVCAKPLFYQDFKDTFVCNTQHANRQWYQSPCCFIRISKILLYAIHNNRFWLILRAYVVLSGFQRYFCMQYTTFCS